MGARNDFPFLPSKQKEGEGMKNIEMQIDGDILTVKIDLSQRQE